MARNALFLLVVLFPASVGAFPAVPGDCPQDDRQSAFKGLTQKANIIGPTDDRRSLSQVQKELGFSDEEVRQANACAGDLVCPNTAVAGSATSVYRADRLITARHIFIDKQGHVRPGSDKCFFRSFSKPDRKIGVVVNQADLNSGKNPYVDVRLDFMVLSLKQPLTDCVPYAIDESGSLLKVDDQIITLTGYQSGLPPDVSNREPVVQQCTVHRISKGLQGLPSKLYYDCDMKYGGSGGVNLVRINGRLVAKGVVSTGSADASDGLSYSDFGSSTISPGLDGDFLEQLLGHRITTSIPTFSP